MTSWRGWHRDVIVKTISTGWCEENREVGPQVPPEPGRIVIEIEVQNETHQTVFRIKTVAVPRIGEGIRLREPNGSWASYDVLDVWYQQAEFGEVWMPYVHVRMTPDELRAVEMAKSNPMVDKAQAIPIEDFLKKFEGDVEHETVKLNLDMGEGN